MSGFGFPPVWLSVIAHSQFPLNSGIGVVPLGFPQLRDPSLSASSFLPAWSSLVAHSLFSPNSDLGVCLPSVLPQFGAWCFYTPSSPPVWSLVLCHPQFHPALELAACPLSILWEFGVWGIVCSLLSVDLELRGCLPWTQLSGNVPSRVGLLLWVLPHPCIPIGTGESK